MLSVRTRARSALRAAMRHVTFFDNGLYESDYLILIIFMHNLTLLLCQEASISRCILHLLLRLLAYTKYGYRRLIFRSAHYLTLSFRLPHPKSFQFGGASTLFTEQGFPCRQ
jgi:hypothetical protein